MLISPHVATGAALGALMDNPLVVIPLAIASHFVLDAVPHWQETLAPYNPTWKTYVRIPIDVVIGLAIVLLALQLHPDHAWSIWLGAVFASAPDMDVMVIMYPQLKRGLLERYWKWHCLIQRETSSLWGVLPQLGVIALGVLVICWA